MDLETERLVVRPLATDDLADIHRVLDEAFGEGRLADDPAALRERRSWLAWTVLSQEWAAKLHQPAYGERAVTLKATGELLGAVGYVPCFNAFEQIPELSADGRARGLYTPEFGLFWAMGARHRRQGYATEAAGAMIAHAFEAMRLKRIVATTEYDNVASQGVMRKLGMRVLRNPRPNPPWLQVVGALDNPKLKGANDGG